MKIRATFKDPDTMQDAVDDAYAEAPVPAHITEEEWAGIRESRATKAKHEITDRWMEYGEYITVEFDLEAKTATVLSSRQGDDF